MQMYVASRIIAREARTFKENVWWELAIARCIVHKIC